MGRADSSQYRHICARPRPRSGACLAAAPVDPHLLDIRLGNERGWARLAWIRQADGEGLAFQSVTALARLAGVGIRLRRETDRRRLGTCIGPACPTHIPLVANS